MGEGIFWVGGAGWTIFISGQDEWGPVEVSFGWIGVDEHFLWVGDGGWRYILGG